MKLYRKLTALCLSAALAAGMAITASADVSPVRVVVNGETASNSAYINSDWRTMVPVETAEAMGIEYTVEGDSVTFTANGIAQTYTAGSAAGDTVATLVDGTLYVPFYHLAQTFGFQVSWDSAAKAASATGSVAEETEPQPETSSAKDLDEITDLAYDWSQAAQLPLTGWYTKSFDGNRRATVYIAEEASIRSYFTIIAVPDGVDTQKFLEDEGWIDLMDQKGEGLYVLEPGANGWGTAEEEADYLDSAISFLKSGNNASKQNVFSTFGEFYVAGYGKGAAALELWAAKNPIFVIGQVYMDGTSAGSSVLTSAASTLYDGKSANGDITEVLTETLQKVGIGGQIAPKDVPVPTWLVGYTGSEDYWKTANDCVSGGETVNGSTVYYQSKDSNAYQTHYANSQLPASAQYGISQVRVSQGSPKASDLYAFMSVFTRYDTTFAYSNALAYRLDYTSARVAAQQQAKGGGVKETLSDGTQILDQSDAKLPGHGTVQVGVIAFSDNSSDGKWDPREYMLYVPESVQGKKAPVLIIFPGNTQTDSIFMDSTLWWEVADQKGIVLAFVCETYNASPCSVSHADSDKFYASLMTILKEQVDGSYATLDFSRVYGSGQSAGSIASQGFAMTNPEFFAAVGSTSAIPIPQSDPDFESYDAMMRLAAPESNQPIPTMLLSGQMDVSDLAACFDSKNLQAWGKYMLAANGIDSAVAPDKANKVTSVDSRHNELYTWSKKVDGTDIPLVQWATCLLRPHNCYPSEMPILWDFMEHFSFEKAEDGTITRYYSVSAFQADDAVVIP